MRNEINSPDMTPASVSPDVKPAERLSSRSAAAARFCSAVAISAGVTAFLSRLLPRRLSVVTDIVGYPIHSNFNVYLYFQRYYLTVLFFPLCTLVMYHLIGLRWPGSRWPVRPQELPVPQQEGENGAALVLQQIARVLVVGVTLGLGWTLCGFNEHVGFWRGLAAAALVYAIAPLGVAAIAVRQARFSGRFVEISARFNSLFTPLTIMCLYAASLATRVRVGSDGSIHDYPWLPGWLAVAGTALLLAVMLFRILRARDLRAVRCIEAQGILFVAVPVVLFLYTAGMPGVVSSLDTFHDGEFLAGAWLLDQGAFPWRDMIFIHGLLQDVVSPFFGFKIFGDSVWGGRAGFTMFGAPFWWIAHYFLFVYLFRRHSVLLLAALAVPLSSAFPYIYFRFGFLPLIILALAALLERATWLRSFVLVFAMLVANVLVPELAYAVAACGVVLLAYELDQYRKARGLLSNFPRTLRVVVVGVVLGGIWFVFLEYHQAAGAFLNYYATFAPGHELTGGIPMTDDRHLRIAIILPPAMVLLSIWYVAAAVRTRKALAVRDWAVVPLALMTLLYYSKFLSRADAHVYQALTPALPLIYYAVHKLLVQRGEAPRSRGMLVISGAGLLAATLLLAPRDLPNSLSRVPENFSQGVPQQPVIDGLGWSDSGPQLVAEAAEWTDIRTVLDAYLEAGDTVFDFTNQPGIYHYLLRRKPATRYYDVQMALRRATQLDLIDELSRTRPKLVVFHADNYMTKWDGVPNVVRHYEISRYLLQQYRPFVRIHGQVFYMRNDLTIEPRQALPQNIEFLSDEKTYSGMPECDWGYAPNFLRMGSFEAGPAAELRPIARRYRITVSGWAADASSKHPAHEVLVLAHGVVIGRGIPEQKRKDVVSAIGAPASDKFGFRISLDWDDERQLDRTALRVYAVSQDHQAWELTNHWRSPSAEPVNLMVGSGSLVPVRPHAVFGWVETANVEREVITAVEFKVGPPITGAAGLEIDADSTVNAEIAIVDQPLVSATPNQMATTLSPMSMSFRIPAHVDRTFRVMLDNCPQWSKQRGPIYYLRHTEAVQVRGVRFLIRGEARESS